MRLRVLTADKRMPPGDASAGFGEGLRTGRRDEKTREENPQHKSNTLARVHDLRLASNFYDVNLVKVAGYGGCIGSLTRRLQIPAEPPGVLYLFEICTPLAGKSGEPLFIS